MDLPQPLAPTMHTGISPGATSSRDLLQHPEPPLRQLEALAHRLQPQCICGRAARLRQRIFGRAMRLWLQNGVQRELLTRYPYAGAANFMPMSDHEKHRPYGRAPDCLRRGVFAFQHPATRGGPWAPRLVPSLLEMQHRGPPADACPSARRSEFRREAGRADATAMTKACESMVYFFQRGVGMSPAFVLLHPPPSTLKDENNVYLAKPERRFRCLRDSGQA